MDLCIIGYNKNFFKENVMEKTTKKRKKSKRLRRRIGLVAIGGLSLVLTVCLSVGATLAWFAGSTWASNDMYMGGPVYVEMAGRGHASGDTAGNGTTTASWEGGNGELDILASGRTTGTANDTDANKILLPGQKLLIYSQARVFSTAYSSSVGTTGVTNESSGANTTNTSSENGKATYTTGRGRIVTTTTSVLRARFSINVEFDPYVGFNNFTDIDYAKYYPAQSADYQGENGVKLTAEADAPGGRTNIKKDQVYYALATTTALPWEAACGGKALGVADGRRDSVDNTGATWLDGKDGTTYSPLNIEEGYDKALGSIKKGTHKAIYEWKYVSLKEYKAAGTAPAASGESFVKMGAPFDGTINSAGTASNTKWNAGGTDVENNSAGTGNGFYGVWVCKDGEYLESDAFYKARTTAYMNSYKEHYKDEYNRQLALTVTSSLSSLENALNNAFVSLVNESSDRIMAGATDGFKVNTGTGAITDNSATTGRAHKASWLYVDSSISADTNAGDSASQNSGWWYLVANTSDSANVTNGDTITMVTDVVKKGETAVTNLGTIGASDLDITHTTPETTATRASLTQTAATNATSVLNAKLYEIVPDINSEVLKAADIANGVSGVTKIVSDAFPFVNGDFELPGRELTNIFANAKISFQISFQALQAFLPYTPSIDGIKSGTPITGTAKALNIGNAAPIFNEAFDYLTVL